MIRVHKSLTGRLAVASALLLVAACSGGSGSRSSRTSPVFAVEEISLAEGAIWRINRPIDITFTDQVDFATVNLNSINIIAAGGESATGSFSLRSDGRTVRFSPTCPSQEDFSDAGLKPDTAYSLRVAGGSNGGVTVLSTSGDGVDESLSIGFATPDSFEPLALFIDTVAGPPSVRVRNRGAVGTDEMAATYLALSSVLETGEIVEERVYYSWNSSDQEARLEPSPLLADGTDDQLIPLNLYSEVETQVAVVMYVDQPVNPSAVNISDSIVSLEYEDGGGNWTRMTSSVELVANCTETGAIIQLTPSGILPQGTGLRVNLRQGFQDLTGDPTIVDTSNFARMTSSTADNPVDGSGDDARSSDELLVDFALSGASPDSYEDLSFIDLAPGTGIPTGNPYADWGGGELQASFDFGGTGGPGGDFSWHIDSGTVILDSTTDVITGGPNGDPTSTQTVVNGVVDVKDLLIANGATLIVQGPNPLTILASGNVTINGTLSVNGTSSSGVGTLNTTFQPEPGGAGQAGGGAGGTGSYLTNQSTPRGGPGFGAFQASGLGGEGGETGYSTGVKSNRRGAGGGGGAFGPNVVFPWDENDSGNPDFNSDPAMLCQTLIGLDGEPGFDGGPEGTGAESQSERARGGQLGPAPFYDANPNNNFLGTKIREVVVFADGEPVDPPPQQLVIGELTGLWAGAGGGAGGDAVESASFPLVPFNQGGDEKGAGGGGGAGGLMIMAVGDITIGANGRISADGGAGGGGENTNFFDRVGGGSGGGSGGHIVISTAGTLRINSPVPGSAVGTRWYNDDVNNLDRERAITALGGQGGAGQDNRGGNNSVSQVSWRCDAIPFEAFADQNTSDIRALPPIEVDCFRALNGVGNGAFNVWEDPDNQALAGAGGDGSPGIIQIHVDDPATDITFANIGGVWGTGADVTKFFAPPPHGWNSPAGVEVFGDTTSVIIPPDRLLPFFGQESSSRSKWIPLGLARENEGDVPVELQFSGLAAGVVAQDGDMVDLGAPLTGPTALTGTTTAAPFVTGDSQTTMVLSAADLTGANEVYLRNPNLLRQCTILLEEAGNEAANFARYDIASATYDLADNRIILDVAGGTALALTDVATVDTLVSLERRDFSVVTEFEQDFLPAESSIQIQFQATVADNEGNPSEAAGAASDLVSDINDLNSGGAQEGEWDFIRFQVTFDLDAANSGANLAEVPRPALSFLRIPFGF